MPLADFTYNGNRYCSFRITDSDIYCYPAPYGVGGLNAHLGFYKSAYILVSLPNDQWSLQNSFYKYVAGIVF